MKKFLTKILLFLLPVILIAYPLDILISNNLKKSVEHVDGEYLVWNDIYTSSIDVDIAIYGSSRAWIHISPEILKDSLNLTAYNFGIDGLNFSFQYFRHKQYLKYNKVPKYIIFSADIFTFESEEGFYNHEQALPYMLFNMDYCQNRKTLKVFNTCDFFLPLKRYSGQTWEIARAFVVGLGLESGPPKRNNGYMAIDRVWGDELEVALKTKGEINVKSDSKLISLFDKFLIECSKMGIKVIMIYSPEYIEGRKFVKNRDEIIELYSKVAARHNIVFIDYSADSICYNRDYFYNSTHLNATGSELFSKKLAEDLKPIIFTVPK